MGKAALLGAVGVAWIAAVAFAACTDSSGGSADADADATVGSDSGPAEAAGRTCTRVPEGGACGRWPASADTFDEASRTGCRPRAVSLVCQVPNGSVIGPDGAVSDPDGAAIAADCCDLCELTEYALDCLGGGGPDPALGCHAPKDITPGAHPLCCPCTP
jgi:hypothetical protein